MMRNSLSNKRQLSKTRMKNKSSPTRKAVASGEHDDVTVRSNNFAILKVPFPWKLWQLLDDSETNGTQSIVSWLPTGDGFTIYKPRAFTLKIMESYFHYPSYSSFTTEVCSQSIPISVSNRISLSIQSHNNAVSTSTVGSIWFYHDARTGNA